MNKFVAGKASILVITAVFAVSAFLLGRAFTSVYATAGEAELGDECDVTPNDASHTCVEGLVCIPQGNENGNGKCGYASSPSASPTASPTPTATPFCDPEEDECPTATPTPTATPEASSTPDTDVCDNLDGIQTSLPDGMHFDNAGKNCLNFDQPGAPNSPAAPQGQVLGASTMAKTGSFAESLYLAIMGLGGALTTKAVKGLKKAFKKA